MLHSEMVQLQSRGIKYQDSLVYFGTYTINNIGDVKEGSQIVTLMILKEKPCLFHLLCFELIFRRDLLLIFISHETELLLDGSFKHQVDSCEHVI